MAKKDINGQLSALGALGLVGQLGLFIALPILAGVVGGVYLDKLVAGKGLVLALAILLGIAAAGFGAYHMLKDYIKEN